MDKTYPIGPHRRQGVRRRRGKAVVLLLVVLALLVLLAPSTSWRETPKQTTHRGPIPPDPVYAANVARLSPGAGQAFIDQFPELEDAITGSVG